MDESGHHRIVDEKGVGGDWAMYESIASSPCGNYIAVTAYYQGTLPSETLLKIAVVPDEEA